MDTDEIKQRAHNLIGASVQDLVASLGHYEGTAAHEIPLIETALQLSEQRGYKTKARLLNDKLKKIKPLGYVCPHQARRADNTCPYCTLPKPGTDQSRLALLQKYYG